LMRYTPIMRLFLAGVMVLGAVALGPSLNATVIVPAEFREVVSGSDLIAYGRVVEVRPQWADGRRRIDSVVTADVLSWFKGGSDRTVSFVVPGGEIGRYRQVTVGAPSFAAGEEVFLFLKTQGSPIPYVFGLNQGVFRVKTDDRGARKVTTPALLAVGSEPETIRRGAVSRRPMPVDDFTSQIRAVIADGRGAVR
ncbi:MAG: hypothetical protein ABI211_06975, partial [Vicinamibacterales bacterium]